jgi:hypothetical protein
MSPFMETRAFQQNCRKVVIIAAACIAMGLLSTACGGGGGGVVDPVFTAGFSISPSAVNFGNQAVGTTSAALSATLINVGNATLTFSSIEVTGPNAGDYTLTSNCGSSLAPSNQCTLSLTFTPSAAGARTGSVVFMDNAAGSPQVIALTGTGVGTAPMASLSTNSLTFGSQSLRTTSPALAVTLRNTGNAPFTYTPPIPITGANPGDFSESDNCGGSVAAGANCAIRVTFTPSAVGTRTASLTLTSNASNSPQVVSLSGTGTSSAVSLSPSTLTFASQPVDTTSTPQVVNLTNTGTVALSITGLAMTGTNPGDFGQLTTCSATLAANTSCTIAVIFTPVASGSRSGTLVFTDNNNNVANSTQTTTLTGTGLHDVVLTWTASSTSGILGYDIYRGTSSGGESTAPLNSSPVSATTYVDTNVTPGTTYYYVVTAVAANGTTQSSASTEASATVP